MAKPTIICYLFNKTQSLNITTRNDFNGCFSLILSNQTITSGSFYQTNLTEMANIKTAKTQSVFCFPKAAFSYTQQGVSRWFMHTVSEGWGLHKPLSSLLLSCCLFVHLWRKTGYSSNNQQEWDFFIKKTKKSSKE